MNHKLKIKWLLITLWLGLMFKEIAWYGIGLEFWRQLEWGAIIYFGLPITIMILALLNLFFSIPGLSHPETRKISIASILSAFVCASLATIGLWGVAHG
jgi:uncharacterized BrkB/YihY/UPF0761 family membrane protein